MVRAIIVSRYKGPPDPPVGKSSDKQRKILYGPLYPAEEVRVLLNLGEVNAATDKCIKDVQKWDIDLIELISQALVEGKYIDSEWAQLFDDGPWAACDAYSLTRIERMPAAATELKIAYYLKFAVSITNRVVITVSCHPSD